MAARSFFRARLLLSCFKRNSRISETVSTSTTSVNSLYSRKIVSGVQCSSCKGKTAIVGWIGSARTRKMVIKIENQHTTTSYLFITNFHKLYTTFAERALVAILSNTPTTSSARTPRVTRTKRILATIVEQFDEKNREE